MDFSGNVLAVPAHMGYHAVNQAKQGGRSYEIIINTGCTGDLQPHLFNNTVLVRPGRSRF